MLICLSASANSHPTPPLQPFLQMQPQRLNQQHLRKVFSDQDAARLWLAHSCIIRSRHQRKAALSDSLRI